MQLSKFSDYALRVLMFLGLRRERVATAAEVADAYGISRHHLVKVARQLGQLGLVAACRGRGGGMRLLVEPEDVVIGDVVRATENLQLAECMTGDGSCPLEGACVLQRALGRARDAFLGELDVVTLADLVRPASALRRRLPTG